VAKRDDTIEGTRHWVQQEVHSAFQEYVGSVKSILAETEASGLDTHAVAALGQMLIAAALQADRLSEA